MSELADAANRRIDGLESLAVTLTLAVPVVAGSLLSDPRRADFESPWFIAAMVTFFVMLFLGLFARSRSGVKLLSPVSIYDDGWLDLAESDFKEGIVYWAGEHWRHNSRLVFWKAWAAVAMTVLFMLEVILFVGWIATIAD